MNLKLSFVFLPLFLFSFTSAANTVRPQSAPLLSCTVSYAGTSQIIDTVISADPYIIPSVNIQDRFRFKAVMIGEAKKIFYIKLYTYFQTRSKDILVHQASFFPPFKLGSKPQILTPKNAIYAGEVERELQYQCTLQGGTK
jgi:hypothetical protein